MKTINILRKAIYLLTSVLLISLNSSCAAIFDAELNGNQSIPFTQEGLLDLKAISDRLDQVQNNQLGIRYYPNQFIDASAGFGLNAIEGQSETSFCFGAGYNYRLSEDNYNHASYVGVHGEYLSQSADQSDLSLFRVGANYTYFDRITKNGEVDLTYGIKGYYESGNQEFSGFKEAITGYGANLVIGANYNVSDNISIGVEVPFLSWSQRTFEFDGGDFEQQSTWLGLNKNNMVMATARFGF
ncbi:MAG: hypothetical protein GYB32_10010 [Algicola sp.]|nr:hypothetical protein [Algicola sp.]